MRKMRGIRSRKSFRYMSGIPLFNLVILTIWTIIVIQEQRPGYWDNPDGHWVSIFYPLIWGLLFGGFAVAGIICGAIYITKQHNESWSSVIKYTIITAIGVVGVYLIFYFVILNNHSDIWRYALSAGMQQSIGFLIGCVTKKMILAKK